MARGAAGLRQDTLQQSGRRLRRRRAQHLKESRSPPRVGQQLAAWAAFGHVGVEKSLVGGREGAVKRGGEHVQKLTDKFVKQIDDTVGSKEKEIMEV